MNEGWATYWHSTIMTRHGLEPNDVVNYADHCSGTLATSHTRLNPYKLGVELFRDIEDRWNRGCFGEDYEQCDDLRLKRHWNTAAGIGRQKIFEVRRVHNDLTFLDEFLTLDFCRQHKLFSFGYNEESGYYEIESREFEKVKKQLLFNLTNLGRPIIRVRDGNYKNRGELFLEHRYNGVELKLSYATDTLANLYRLWARPVHIQTVLGDQNTILSFDGKEHTTSMSNERVTIDET
jgi:stage V sporulation protein R